MKYFLIHHLFPFLTEKPLTIIINPSDFRGNIGDMATLIVAATGEAAKVEHI